MITTAADSDSTALSKKTHALPTLAIKAPATRGPTILEAFIDTPLSASAAGNCERGTNSGTMAENTGQRRASPTPLANTSTKSKGGDSTPRKTVKLSTLATTATQIWVISKNRRLSRMSAKAPLGSPSKNTGKLAAVWTSATHKGVAVNEVIIQAAATSLIHRQMLAISQVLQSMRNTGWRNGAKGERSSSDGTVGGGVERLDSGMRPRPLG